MRIVNSIIIVIIITKMKFIRLLKKIFINCKSKIPCKNKKSPNYFLLIKNNLKKFYYLKINTKNYSKFMIRKTQ